MKRYDDDDDMPEDLTMSQVKQDKKKKYISKLQNLDRYDQKVRREVRMNNWDMNFRMKGFRRDMPSSQDIKEMCISNSNYFRAYILFLLPILEFQCHGILP